MSRLKTAPPFPNIGAALAWQAQEHPDEIALVFPEHKQSLSFAGWFAESMRVASGLSRLGVTPGQHVALLSQNRIEWPVVQLAVALCGAVLVPINTHFGRDDLRFVLEHSKSHVLFVSNQFRSHAYLEMAQELRPYLPCLDQIVTFDGEAPNSVDYWSFERTREEIQDVAASDIAGLLYTSGTTGFPKGALLSHRAMLYDAWQVSKRLGIKPSDRWTSIIPLFHCAGCIMNILGALQNGACYVGVEAFSPLAMFETIESECCTVLSGVPTSYLAMLEHPRRHDYDLSSLRTGTCGGADAHPDLLRTCADQYPIPYLVNVYGQTESATVIACPYADDEERFDTVGTVLDGAVIRITEPETGEVLPPEVIGQVEARGPMVMTGYLDRAEATRETLSEDGWLRTGDLGLLSANGKLRLSGGRLRDMVIRGGENIYPVEIENWLMSHPSVHQVAVFSVPDRYYGEAVGAAIVLAEPVRSRELVEYCRGQLARFKIPTLWFEIDSLPLTASGKVRKVALQSAFADDTLLPLD